MIVSEFPFTGALVPKNASAVILINEDGLYIMQRRDDKPGIFYPGFLGLFGGACEDDESFMQTAVRELEEEISLDLEDRLKFFSQMTLGFEPMGCGHVERAFFTGCLSNQEIKNIQLGEGQGIELVEAKQLLKNEHVVPYDAFALWLHCNATNT